MSNTVKYAIIGVCLLTAVIGSVIAIRSGMFGGSVTPDKIVFVNVLTGETRTIPTEKTPTIPMPDGDITGPKVLFPASKDSSGYILVERYFVALQEMIADGRLSKDDVVVDMKTRRVVR